MRKLQIVETAIYLLNHYTVHDGVAIETLWERKQKPHTQKKSELLDPLEIIIAHDNDQIERVA